MGRKVFVAVSTRQNVANLPPILEIAEPGDRAVWIVTDEAHRQRWAEGSTRVLERLGSLELSKDLRIRSLMDLSGVAKLVAGVAHDARAAGDRVVLVANGGNKLTPLGLRNGCPEADLLYGSDRPAELWVFPSGGGPPSVRPYVRHRMDLSDVLEASGFCFFETPQRLWPGSAPSGLEGRYAEDREETGRLHRDHARWGEIGMPSSFPRFEAVMRLPAARRKRWKRSLDRLIREGRGAEDAVWEEAYEATRALAQEAAKAEAGREAGVRRPEGRLGPEMERAVARRVRRWLERTNGRGVVQAVWRNVRVAATGSPHRVVGELDLVFVLKNGILLHLECKSHGSLVEQKELDARLKNLQTVGSQLAELAVCLPVFTDFQREPWFEETVAAWERLEERRISMIPLTLPGQPRQVLSRQGAASWEKTCPSFEASLEKWIRPYVPRS